MKNGKQLACDVFDTFATCPCLVHDVIDRDCWVQNSSILCCLFATSMCAKGLFLTVTCMLFFFYRAEKQRRAEEAQRALAETARRMAAAEIARLQGGDCGLSCQQWIRLLPSFRLRCITVSVQGDNGCTINIHDYY